MSLIRTLSLALLFLMKNWGFFQSLGYAGIRDGWMKAFLTLVEKGGSGYGKGAMFSQSVDGDLDLCGAIETLGSPGPWGGGVRLYWHKYYQISLKQDGPVTIPEAFPVCLVLTGSGQEAKQMKGAAVTLAWSVPRAAFKANPSKESLCISHQDSCSDYVSPNRQINELKATLLEKGGRRREGRWGEWLLAVLTQALGVINESTHGLWHHWGGTCEALQNKSIGAAKGNFKVPVSL